ncbi:MAG: group II truncated hemoglobin [Zoogloeaceae bacterium]|jgi:hemoglobin|nr:group II truncated hemoglobin [Zoogloeaceae bacterium]
MQKELSLHEAIGGAPTIRRLVARFYALMDAVPRFADLRALHPADLAPSQEKLFAFLSGWLGGPDLFVERYGHPRLRERHLAFPIGKEARDQWLACMLLAMEESGIAADLREALLVRFFHTADFLRNLPESPSSVPAPGQDKIF